MDPTITEAILAVGVGTVFGYLILRAWIQANEKVTESYNATLADYKQTIQRITDERQTNYQQLLERAYEQSDRVAHLLSIQTQTIAELRDAVDHLANYAAISEQLRRLHDERDP